MAVIVGIFINNEVEMLNEIYLFEVRLVNSLVLGIIVVIAREQSQDRYRRLKESNVFFFPETCKRSRATVTRNYTRREYHYENFESGNAASFSVVKSTIAS